VISALFGFSHYQQGGIIEEGSDGLILGLMCLAYRRNLAIPIVAHGVCDTIDIALFFLGKYPGRRRAARYCRGEIGSDLSVR
jgi:membrane protease YdiL (CAAX protease family)